MAKTLEKLKTREDFLAFCKSVSHRLDRRKGKEDGKYTIAICSSSELSTSLILRLILFTRQTIPGSGISAFVHCMTRWRC